MTQRIPAERLIEQVARVADEAELYEFHSLALPVRFAAGTLESVKSVEMAGRALRLIKDGRLGFSTTTDLSDGTTLVQNALQSAQLGDAAGFHLPGLAPAPEVACFDVAVQAMDEAALIALGDELVQRVRAYDSQLHIEASVGSEVVDVRLLNTAGLDVHAQRTTLGCGVDAARVREGDILTVGDSHSTCRRQDVDVSTMTQRVIERLRWAEKTVSVSSRAMPVVFHLAGTLVPLLPLIPGLSGRQVYLGASPLRDKLGQRAFAPEFTLVDDARLDYAVRSAAYDDEGVPTRTKPLIENGVVCQFLYNLKAAALAGTQSSGNGFKSGLFGGDFRAQPSIAAGTWSVQPGQRSLPALLADLDEALLVEQVIGLGQGNVISGEFSNNLSLGFLVRRGEVVGRVKNTMIAGNVYELLRERLIGLSDRPEWVYGVLRAPALALDGVSVASNV